MEILTKSHMGGGRGMRKYRAGLRRLRIRRTGNQDRMRPNKGDRVGRSEGGRYQRVHCEDGGQHREGEERDGGEPGRYVRRRDECHGD